jgi:polyisoprenoid-binding protein YceI
VTAIEVATFPVGTYNVDKLHSYVGFAVKHAVVATFRGQFKDIDATLVCTGERISLVGSARVGSISIEDDNLRGHLLSPDFFDAVRAPEIRFVSSDVRVAGDGTVDVDGQLTIKAFTRDVQATGVLSGPTTDAFGNERVGLELETTVDRTAYGLNWNMPLPNGGVAVGNEVTLTISLGLLRENA